MDYSLREAVATVGKELITIVALVRLSCCLVFGSKLSRPSPPGRAVNATASMNSDAVHL
jgi:hypothetical protein